MGWREELKDYPRLAPDFELDPMRTALLPIDMQYCDAHPDYGLGLILRDNYPEVHTYYYTKLRDVVVPNHIKLINFFRQNKLRIIYITLGPMMADGSDYVPLKKQRFDQIDKTSGHKTILFPPGSFERQILQEVKPVQGELVVNKISSGAFNSTAIERTLLNVGIDGLVITGVVTHACVETTARDAADRGFKCILVDDACATFGQEIHDATMKAFAIHYGRVATTDEVLAYLKQRLSK